MPPKHILKYQRTIRYFVTWCIPTTKLVSNWHHLFSPLVFSCTHDCFRSGTLQGQSKFKYFNWVLRYSFSGRPYVSNVTQRPVWSRHWYTAPIYTYNTLSCCIQIETCKKEKKNRMQICMYVCMYCESLWDPTCSWLLLPQSHTLSQSSRYRHGQWSWEKQISAHCQKHYC